MTAKCEVCGEGEGNKQFFYCKKCGAPHHPECWGYNGLCAIFGCGCMEHVNEPLKINNQMVLAHYSNKQKIGAFLMHYGVTVPKNVVSDVSMTVFNYTIKPFALLFVNYFLPVEVQELLLRRFQIDRADYINKNICLEFMLWGLLAIYICWTNPMLFANTMDAFAFPLNMTLLTFMFRWLPTIGYDTMKGNDRFMLGPIYQPLITVGYFPYFLVTTGWQALLNKGEQLLRAKEALPAAQENNLLTEAKLPKRAKSKEL